MRKLFLSICFLFSLQAISQDLSKKIKDLQQEAARHRAELDSSKKVRDSLFLLQLKKVDSANMASYMEQNTRNLNSLMAGIKERERKQKQGMWLRIGAGILFLGIGIYGVMRKRKPKTGNTGS